jgi:hypothetical protein
MDMKNRIRNENVSGSRPVISRFYFHLRAGGFHPSSTIHINSPPNPNHLRLHLSLQNNRFQKKKKHPEEQNSTPPDPAGRRLADAVAASSPDQRQRAQPRRSPSRSRPPVQTSDSEHNPASRRAGRGLQSRPATCGSPPPPVHADRRAGEHRAGGRRATCGCLPLACAFWGVVWVRDRLHSG